jgi:hypothetical protein
MSDLQSHQEIALASIKCFTDDGKLDLEEFNFLLGLALRDNKVDEEEKRVLGNILDQVSAGSVSQKLEDRISQVKKLYSI